MPNTLLRCVRADLATVCVVVTWDVARRIDFLPWHLVSTGVLALAIVTACAILLQRVRREDDAARLEAARWREQKARNRADFARAEVELLMFEVTAVDVWRDGALPAMSMQNQIAHVQAELARLQQNAKWAVAGSRRATGGDGAP